MFDILKKQSLMFEGKEVMLNSYKEAAVLKIDIFKHEEANNKGPSILLNIYIKEINKQLRCVNQHTWKDTVFDSNGAFFN